MQTINKNTKTYNPTLSYITENFILTVEQLPQSTNMVFKMLNDHIKTGTLPLTFDRLSELFPEVLGTKCFNKKHLPFCEEVKNTETGHLFEHILIAYLHQLKKNADGVDMKFSGVTVWDWNEEPKGTYQITINSEGCYDHIMPKALQMSVVLMDKILS